MKKIIRKIKKYLVKKEIVPILQIKESEQILQNKVAVITGGSGGIGFAIAQKFLSCGAKVIICGTSEEKLKEMVNKVDTEMLSYCVVNLNHVSSFSDKVIELVKIYGKIDILVNSAGIHSTNPIQDFFAYNEKEYDDIMNINLKGTYFFSREIAKYMVENKILGHILNISSSTSNEPAWSPYRISKWAMNGFTKGLADRLLPYGIIVNGIAPGSTATQLLGYSDGDSIYSEDNALGRMIIPEEIAEYAKLLVSDSGKFVIGETIYISGGRGNLYYPTYSNNK